MKNAKEVIKDVQWPKNTGCSNVVYTGCADQKYAHVLFKGIYTSGIRFGHFSNLVQYEVKC